MRISASTVRPFNPVQSCLAQCPDSGTVSGARSRSSQPLSSSRSPIGLRDVQKAAVSGGHMLRCPFGFVAQLNGALQRISQSILTLRMLCEMRYLLGARSVERSGPAGIDDYAADDAGATVVGLEAVSDVPHVGVLAVLAVGV